MRTFAHGRPAFDDDWTFLNHNWAAFNDDPGAEDDWFFWSLDMIVGRSFRNDWSVPGEDVDWSSDPGLNKVFWSVLLNDLYAWSTTMLNS